jgi:hypothetical protein
MDAIAESSSVMTKEDGFFTPKRILPLPLNQYRSFAACADALRRVTTKTKRINAASIPDGDRIANDVEPSDSTLGVLPAEFWTVGDLRDNHDRLKCAGTPEWSERLGLPLQALSPVESRIVRKIIGAPPAHLVGLADSGAFSSTRSGSASTVTSPTPGGAGSGPPSTASGAALSTTTPSAGAEAPTPSTFNLLSQLTEEADEEDDEGHEGGSGGGAAEQETGGEGATAGSGTGGSGGGEQRSTRAAAAARAAARAEAVTAPREPPSTPQQALHAMASQSPARTRDTVDSEEITKGISARAVHDVTRMNMLRDRMGGLLSTLQGEFPLCLKLLAPGGDVANLKRAHLFLLVDIEQSIVKTKAVLEGARAMAKFEHDSGSDQGAELVRALEPRRLDKTLHDTWLDMGDIDTDPGTIERVYGIPPIVSLTMALLKSFFTPVESDASRHLRKVSLEAEFLNREGALDIAGPAGRLAEAMGEAAESYADCSWDTIYRNIVAAVAQASRVMYVIRTPAGQELDWSKWAMSKVVELNERGMDVPYKMAHVEAVTTDLSRFARVQSRETALIASLRQDGGQRAVSYMSAVRGGSAEMTPEVNRVEMLPCSSCTGPAHQFRADKSICGECGGHRDSWQCSECGLLTPVGYRQCGRGRYEGCTGTEDRGQPAPAEAVARISGAVMSSKAASLRGPAARGGGGGGGRPRAVNLLLEQDQEHGYHQQLQGYFHPPPPQVFSGVGLDQAHVTSFYQGAQPSGLFGGAGWGSS